MNWHSGNIAEAVAESKSKNAIFVVFIQGENELSSKLERFVDDQQVRSRLETSDFVAIKVQGNSTAYGQFMSLYKVVPIPSIFFIGKSGTPLDVATGIIGSAEDLVAKIDKVLVLSGKREENQQAATSNSSRPSPSRETKSRKMAGADDTASEKAQQPKTDEVPQATSLASKSTTSTPALDSSSTAAPEKPSVSSKTGAEPPDTPVVGSTIAAGDNKNPSTTSAGVRPSPPLPVQTSASAELLTLVGSGSSSSQPATAASAAVSAPAEPTPTPTPAEPTPTPTQQQPTDSSVRMAEIQNRQEEKRREQEQEQEQRQKRERENTLRRRREGKEAQTQEALTKEQELKNMQERIRRNRQEEQETRDRIRAQIAADRAEQVHRVLPDDDVHIATNSSAATVMSDSFSFADQTRLQIRLPDGVQRTKSFPIGALLGTVRIYVRNELLSGTDRRDFTLATSYPRREFRTEDEVKTLLELNLVPNAVVLVLTKEQVNRVVRTGGSLMSMLTTVMWAMITPAAKAFDYIRKNGWRPISQQVTVMLANVRWPGRDGGANVVLVQGDAAARRNMDMFSMRPMPAPGLNPQPAPEAPETESTTPPAPASPGTGNDAAGQQPAQTPPTVLAHATTQAQAQEQQFQARPGGYQAPRYGNANIRRLHDAKDDKDNKATYNGNSTQQQ
ncbi:UBX domain-containing protein 4 [Drosophila pseudoobscura]|uniref:UBX domain-containing protein 4 n=1 Tax=Drosophila pseudoobscura pseudoobscura TaxID=46245 RepID=A0A6I8UAP7_DROPS|nr:UBX domain-containing protein 4 [Drosophila pseudoobscura]